MKSGPAAEFGGRPSVSGILVGLVREHQGELEEEEEAWCISS